MKEENLFEAINSIDEKYISEAIKPNKRKANIKWIKWVAAAACLCVSVGSVILFADKKMQVTSNDIAYLTEDMPQAEGCYAPILDRFDAEIPTIDNDMAIYNGHFVLSDSLSAAIDKYENTVTYKVVVEVFKDGSVIGTDSPGVASEEKRLANEKYTVYHEKYKVGENESAYFTLCANKEQLLKFSINEEYGYYICFYGEYSSLDRQTDQPDTQLILPDNSDASSMLSVK